METQGMDAAGAAAAGGIAIGWVLFNIVIGLIVLVAAWRIFTKAGQPGWAVLVPIYNAIVFLKVAGKPWWWLFLMMIPFANIVFAIIATVSLAKNFGKGGGFAAGLIFLPMIFYPMLGFGSAKYQPVA